MEKLYCPYCGAPLSDGCDCERRALEEARDDAEYEAERLEKLEELELML